MSNNSPNNSKMANSALMLALRSSNLTSIHQFYELTSTRLRLVTELWYSPRKRTLSWNPYSPKFAQVMRISLVLSTSIFQLTLKKMSKMTAKRKLIGLLYCQLVKFLLQHRIRSRQYQEVCTKFQLYYY